MNQNIPFWKLKTSTLGGYKVGPWNLPQYPLPTQFSNLRNVPNRKPPLTVQIGYIGHFQSCLTGWKVSSSINPIEPVRLLFKGWPKPNAVGVLAAGKWSCCWFILSLLFARVRTSPPLRLDKWVKSPNCLKDWKYNRKLINLRYSRDWWI